MLASAPRLFAVEGISRWEQVLNQVLERAEQERMAKEAVRTQGHAPPTAIEAVPLSGTRALRPIIGNFVKHFRGPGLKATAHP